MLGLCLYCMYYVYLRIHDCTYPAQRVYTYMLKVSIYTVLPN